MRTETKERRPPLTTAAAATYVGMRQNYLEKLRCSGGGPVFIKRAGTVLYDPADLDAWIEAGKRRSTSDMHDGQQYALVADGSLALYADRAGNPPVPIFATEIDPGDTRTWLPLVTEDSQPFDIKLHWRLPPVYTVEADKVRRVYPKASRLFEPLRLVICTGMTGSVF
jgi:hypothetical protein